MDFLLGLDPGGGSNFGWCVANDGTTFPRAQYASGLADNAALGLKAAFAAVPQGGTIVAAGIDAPLYWSRSGSRVADQSVRVAIRIAGAPHPAGTVQDINSLRGACLVQGMLAALELRERFPDLPITEAHPKALRWLLPEVNSISGSSEHERDALLASVAAWAALHRPEGWSNLREREPSAYSPIEQPLLYTMPNVPYIG